MSTTNVLSLPCPVCHVSKDVPCKQRGGVYTRVGGAAVHQARVDLFKASAWSEVRGPKLPPPVGAVPGGKPSPLVAPPTESGRRQARFGAEATAPEPTVPVGVPSVTMTGADGRQIPPPTADHVDHTELNIPVSVGHNEIDTAMLPEVLDAVRDVDITAAATELKKQL